MASHWVVSLMRRVPARWSPRAAQIAGTALDVTNELDAIAIDRRHLRRLERSDHLDVRRVGHFAAPNRGNTPRSSVSSARCTADAEPTMCTEARLPGVGSASIKQRDGTF